MGVLDNFGDGLAHSQRNPRTVIGASPVLAGKGEHPAPRLRDGACRRRKREAHDRSATGGHNRQTLGAGANDPPPGFAPRAESDAANGAEWLYRVSRWFTPPILVMRVRAA